MHSAFHVAELRSLIFDWVSLQSESTQTLLQLALTCTSFSDAALTYLWRSQSSTLPLLRIAPEDLVLSQNRSILHDGAKISLPDFSSFFKSPMEEKPAISRPIEEGELDRLKYYASKVVNLQTSPPSVRGLFHENLLNSLISQLPDWNFLPNLSKLTLHLEMPTAYISRNSRLPFLRTLLSPSIRHLAIISLGLHQVDEWAALFEDVSSQCKNIVHLDIHLRFEKVVSMALSRMVCNMHHLETIECNPSILSSDAIAHLRQMPSLKGWNEIIIELPDDLDIIFNNPGASGITNGHHHPILPSLETISLASSDWNLAAQFMDKLDRPLANLSVSERFDHQRWAVGIGPSLLTLTRSISQNTMRDTLRSLQLQSLSSADHSSIDQDLYPIFLCRQLRIVDLTFDYIYILDNSWIRKAAESWPNLTVIKAHLNNTQRPFDPSEITLSGLVPLVHGCPHLSEVELPAQWIPFDADEIPPGACNRNITRLDFSFMNLRVPPSADKAEQIFKCLIRLFPCLKEITAEDHVRYRVDEVRRLVLEAYELRMLER